MIAASACSCTDWSGTATAHDQCDEREVAIDGADKADKHDVCFAVASVQRFYRNLGFTKVMPLTITIVDRMPASLGPDVLGCFSATKARIHVLSFRAFTNRGMWLEQVPDRLLYRSLAAHELAHALASCNASGGPLSVRAREYLAYTVMFATMDQRHRSQILARASDPGFTKDSQITDLYFYLNPFRFGIDAYRHYLRQERGDEFLRRVLSGEVLPAIED